MAEDQMRYDRLVEDALRSVVKRALVEARDHGLPGEHHFYITFRTEAPGVELPDSLRETYPTEMTIVLQHQFWDLIIEDHRFSVALSFNNIRHHLTVPYQSVVAFADPSVRFGLQFEYEEDPEAPTKAGLAEVTLKSPKPGAKTEASASSDEEADANGDESDTGDGQDGAKVITLDTFRKK